jgi:hypothetical protein
VAGCGRIPERRDGPLHIYVFSLYLAYSARQPFLQLLVLRPDIVVWVPPFMKIAHALDSGLDHLFCAAEAWAHCCEERSASHGYSETRGLQKGVLFGVNADAQIVTFT